MAMAGSVRLKSKSFPSPAIAGAAKSTLVAIAKVVGFRRTLQIKIGGFLNLVILIMAIGHSHIYHFRREGIGDSAKRLGAAKRSPLKRSALTDRQRNTPHTAIVNEW